MNEKNYLPIPSPFPIRVANPSLPPPQVIPPQIPGQSFVPLPPQALQLSRDINRTQNTMKQN